MQEYRVKDFRELESLLEQRIEASEDFFSYEQSYITSAADIADLSYYHLDFEPYISLAYSLGMCNFGIVVSPSRPYIDHLNIGGHAALHIVRPVNLERLQNMDYLRLMLSNYGDNLERNAIPLDGNKL